MRRAIHVNAAQTVLIDAQQGETFFISLITSIQHLALKNVSPGQLYVFVITQDHLGGHAIQWGPQLRNGSRVDTTPNNTTVQSFIGSTGGKLNRHLP